ncbi:DNA mismatch repair protein MutS, partial [Tanacetum coccineum]
DILSQSTSRSLVLLDEVGAGTNPLEGVALGMPLLECFAEARALLTMATHHSELKTLKYSQHMNEGRSNAINIAERLGLPNVVVGNARELHVTASAEINEVIKDMEKLKQKLHEHIHEARCHLKLARELHRNLVVSERRIREHATSQRYRKIQEISDGGGVARLLLHKKVRQRRASTVLASKAYDSPLPPKMASFSSQSTPKESDTANVSEINVKKRQLKRSGKVVKACDMVHVSKFNKKAAVLKVDPSKEEILVQLGNMKLKLKLQLGEIDIDIRMLSETTGLLNRQNLSSYEGVMIKTISHTARASGIFKTELRKEFVPHNVDSKSKAKLRRLCHTCTIIDYIKEFTTILLEFMDIPDQDAIFFFKYGLKECARIKIDRRNVKTLDEAIAAAKSILYYFNRPRRPLAEEVGIERASPKRLNGRRNDGRVLPNRLDERGDKSPMFERSF